MHVGLIYDRLHRPDTTGTYVERALREVGERVTHYAPLVRRDDRLHFRGYGDLPAADWYLSIDDDLGYPPPKVVRPNVYWCIDVHRMDQLLGSTMTRWQKIAAFDLSFSAQKNRAVDMNLPWLPLAADLAVLHRLPNQEKQFDWCFVGNVNTDYRTEVLRFMQARFPNGWVGKAYGADMNRIYNASRLILNISHANDVNMRCFEGQATGTPLLTNRVDNGETELFDHLLLWRDMTELERLARRVLADPAYAAEVGEAQMATLRQRHSYHARVRDMLAAVQARFPTVLMRAATPHS